MPDWMQDIFTLINSGNSLQLWGYFILMLLVMVEGPAAILLASTASSTGFMSPGLVFISAIIGNLIADTLWYSLGYFGKAEWLLKTPKRRFGIEPDQLEVLKSGLQKHARKIIFIAKATNGMIVPVLIATGLAKVKWNRWFPVVFAVEIVITGLFCVAGYYTALNLMKLQHWLRYVAIGFSIIFFIVSFGYVQRLLRKTALGNALPEMENREE